MKKGDIVRCSRSFVFEAVNDEDILTIRINKNQEEREYIPVPLYLHGLGFYPPEFDYCLPGSYLPVEHPDYYRDAGNGTFLYNTEEHRISFDEDFMYTGKYYLIPMSSGGPIEKHAILRSPELRQARIEDSLGQTLDGIMLEGRILEFLVRDRNTNELISIINRTEVKASPEERESRVFCYLQDIVTKVEFQFPATYITLKP